MDDDKKMPRDDQTNVETPVERYRLICGVVERLSHELFLQGLDAGEHDSVWCEIP